MELYQCVVVIRRPQPDLILFQHIFAIDPQSETIIIAHDQPHFPIFQGFYSGTGIAAHLTVHSYHIVHFDEVLIGIDPICRLFLA